MSNHMEVLEASLQQHKQLHIPAYEAALPSNFVMGENPAELLKQEEEYKRLAASMLNKAPIPFELDIPAIINSKYAPSIDNYVAELNRLKTQHDADVQKLHDERERKLHDANLRASAGVKPIIDKHARLMSYKDKVEDVCARYGITPNEIKISTDITPEEYMALLDAAIQGCEAIIKQKNSRFNPLALLYKPMEWSDSPIKQIVAITVFAIVFHNVGGIIALAFFISMYASTIGIYKKLDKLRIAESMMYTPDFDVFMQKDEIEAIAEVDTTEVDNVYNEAVEKLKESDPNGELSKEMQEYASILPQITEAIQACEKEVKEAYDKAVNALNERLADITKHKEEAIAAMKKFGDCMLQEKPLAYPTYKYTLGMINPVIEQQIEVPHGSILFNSEDKNMLNFLKLMLCNALLSVKEKKLSVCIYDPERLGQDFAEFLCREKETHDYISVHSKSVSDFLQPLSDKVASNVRKCGQRTLDEVNKEAEEKQMVTYDYTIAIMVSGLKDFFKDPKNLQLVTTSANFGVRFWIMDTERPEGMHIMESAYDLDGIKTPFPYTFELGEKVTNTFANAILNSKDGSIDYFTSIQERYIPKEKWGTWSTNKGIDLNFGLANGDPSKGFPMVLGDANVHLLMAGQSGAGKSAAINQMLLSLLTKYTPNELQLVMIDFKNVEFSTFTVADPNTTGKLSIIPHAKIMAGTKDGEYALSIFDYLIGEMENRQKLFGAVNQKKLEDYNNLMDEQGHPEKKLPRILLLIDEFQVMFTEVDKKIVDLIQDRIRSLAKLARAFGCHMWFTSQSMSGTMSNDVKANFSMRAALRCTREVSNEIIGNGAAGDIKAKFGYLVTNDSTGQDPTKNILWRVPFVSTKNILKVMNEAADLYRSWGITGYQSEFYDEDQLHYDKELFDFYENNKDNAKVQDPHLFVLGKRTNYSLNNAPVNFYLNQGDFANVLIAGSEDSDLLNLCRTVFDNAKAHGIKCIVSCADEDAHTLLELDERLSGPFLQWSYPNVLFDDWADKDKTPFEKVIQKRLANPQEPREPIYAILYNWDKYVGFGVSENTRKADIFREYLRVGPTVDIHFFLFIKSKGELASSVFSAFKYKIGCLMDEQLSYRIVDSAKCNKLPNTGNFGIFKVGNNESKFKIYQHEFSRKLADKELTL